MSRSDCINCGKCERDCPCHVIKIKGIRPHWHKGCTGCFRCVNTCPVQAIDLSWYGVAMGVIFMLLGWFGAGAFLNLGQILTRLVQITFAVGGFVFGTYLYQRIYLFLPTHKALIMKNKQRSFVAQEEKEL